MKDASRAAGALRARGVQAGEPVACVLANTYESCVSLVGSWLAGAVVISLPIPARGMSNDAYVAQLFELAGRSGAQMLLVDRRAVAMLESGRPPSFQLASFEELDGPPLGDPQPPSADAAAFVQYSSGSTGEPKGCTLTSAAIASQLELLAEHLEIDPLRDRSLTWLPMSHDMGLFGVMLLSWTSGMTFALSSPERFIVSPRSWLDDCAQLGVTATVGPTFALRVATRAALATPPSGPLALRMCVLGAERIDWAALTATVDALAPAGLTLDTFLPAYGLAEATLAVTMTELDEPARALTVDAQRLYEGELVEVADGGGSATRLVACGRPLPGVELELEGDRRIGEILVRSPSLSTGYAHDPRMTAARFSDRGVRTGDLGFIDGGELYIVARADDMLSLAGRKVSALDVEAALCADDGVRRGGCALVDVASGGDTSFVALVEPADGTSDFAELARRLRAVSVASAGVPLSACVFVPRGTLPKTPSGKIQRFRCRQMIASGDGERLGEVAL